MDADSGPRCDDDESALRQVCQAQSRLCERGWESLHIRPFLGYDDSGLVPAVRSSSPRFRDFLRHHPRLVCPEAVRRVRQASDGSTFMPLFSLVTSLLSGAAHRESGGGRGEAQGNPRPSHQVRPFQSRWGQAVGIGGDWGGWRSWRLGAGRTGPRRPRGWPFPWRRCLRWGVPWGCSWPCAGRASSALPRTASASTTSSIPRTPS